MARYTKTKIDALGLTNKPRRGETFSRTKVIDIEDGRIVYRHHTKGLRTRVMTIPLLSHLMPRAA